MKITQIKMLGDNLLVLPIELEAPSEFAHAGQNEGTVYEVAHAGPDSTFKHGDLVILKPGPYDQLVVNGEIFIPVSDSEIIGKAKGGK